MSKLNGKNIDMAGRVVHPNSLQARSERDPELRARIAQGRRKAKEDERSFETWVAGGCASGLSDT